MELNREQIINEIQSLIKALKDCGGWVKRGNGEGWFNHEILADALALINSQERRIKELTEENERLRAENDELCDNIACLEIDLENARTNTVRNMQERLRARRVSYGNITFKVVPIDDIDQIAKEMLEGV